MKPFLLALIFIFTFSGYLYSQAVLGRFNIHLGEPKVERNQAPKEALLAETEAKERDTQARLLESTLENGNYSERDYFAKENNILYTNEFWKLRIQEQNSEGRLDRIEYKVNQSSISSYNGSIELPKVGMNLVEYRSIDKLGNSEDWKIERIFKDIKPPQVNWDLIGKYDKIDDQYFVSSETQIQIQAIDINSGVKGIYYKFNGSRWKATEIDKQNNLAKILLNQDENRESNQNIIEIVIIDNVLNRSNKIQIPYTIVNTINSPNIKLNQVKEVEGINYCNNKSTFNFYTSESRLPERVLYKPTQTPDWIEYVSGTISLLPTDSSINEINLIYKNVNSIGLESEERTFKCKIDLTSPKSEILKVIKD